MNNACPECSAVYAVAEKDIGRRISCKKCNTALIVSEEGLKRDDSAASPPKKEEAERGRDRDEDDDRPRKRDDDERASRKRDRDDDDRTGRKKDRGDDEEEHPRERKKRTGPSFFESFANKMKGLADVATWIYGMGLFLTIYSFFAPVIDKSKTAARQGFHDSEKLEFEAFKRSINQKPDGKEATQDEKKKLDEREKEWEKKTEPALNDDIAAARASESKAVWWNVMFRMIGFFLMAFGSIGYLAPEQSNLKRILGGTTILLILLQIIGGGASIGLALGGRGGPG